MHVIVNDICSILYQDLIKLRSIFIDRYIGVPRQTPPTNSEQDPIRKVPLRGGVSGQTCQDQSGETPTPQSTTPARGYQKGTGDTYYKVYFWFQMYIHPYFKEREVYMCIILMLQLYVVFICITKDILEFVGRGGDACTFICTLINVCRYLKQQGTLILFIKVL